MRIIELFTRSFPFLVTGCALIALVYPPSFTWFSGPWITYGLGGIMLGMAGEFVEVERLRQSVCPSTHITI